MKMKIMFVDDEQEILTLYHDCMEAEKHSSKYFSNPLEAIEAFKKEEFDVAVVDIRMPEMNGLELALKLNEIRRIPIIFSAAAIEDAQIDLVRQRVQYVEPLSKVDFFETLSAQLQKVEQFLKKNKLAA
jgi:CheY-like chemotaxis protein